MEIWNRISYAVQLLAACALFSIPLKRKKYFISRWIAGGGVLIGLSLAVTEVVSYDSYSIGQLLYWGAYILFCIWILYITVDVSKTEAVYCALCACGVQHIAYDFYVMYVSAGGRGSIVPVALFVMVYVFFYFFYIRKLPDNGRIVSGKTLIFPMATMVILIWVFSVIEDSYIIHTGGTNIYRILYRIIDAMCCLYVLWIQLDQKERSKLQRELDHINFLWQQQKKQYQLTSETIDSINRKCHDLKHQIHLMREIESAVEKEEYMKDLEKDIMIYDTALQTGNKALDTVLMEKALYCKNHDINWSFLVDGEVLGFMKLEDIYSIFGNALDNAIEAVEKVDDREKKVITLKMIQHNKLCVIQVQNYFAGDLKFVNDIPVTTKHDKNEHGYGLKSILYIAEKYNGTITIHSADHTFNLQILIPISEYS